MWNVKIHRKELPPPLQENCLRRPLPRPLSLMQLMTPPPCPDSTLAPIHEKRVLLIATTNAHMCATTRIKINRPRQGAFQEPIIAP